MVWQGAGSGLNRDQLSDRQDVSQMKYLLDTGPLVAFLNSREKNSTLRHWAVETLSSLRWPLYTCEAVLTEAGHFLGDPLPLVEMVDAGELVVPFFLSDQTQGVARIIGAYHGRRVSLADACLVRMAELWQDSTVLTIDSNDFAVYRRFGKDSVRFAAPPKA